MISIVANFSKKASSLVLLSSSVSTANLSCLLATTFSSLRFLFNFTSLQSFESEQVLFLVAFYFLIFASYPQSSGLISNVLPSLKLCLPLVSQFLSERFFFVMIKLLLCVVEINNTGVTGQSLPPKMTLSMRVGYVIPPTQLI